MQKQKPYFSKEVVDKIVNVVSCELETAGKTLDSSLEQSLRTYIQAGKNAYENSILASVADGEFLATISGDDGDEMAYKVVPPTKEAVEAILASAKEDAKPTYGQVELVLKQERAARLAHSLNMIGLHKIQKLKLVSAVEV